MRNIGSVASFFVWDCMKFFLKYLVAAASILFHPSVVTMSLLEQHGRDSVWILEELAKLRVTSPIIYAALSRKTEKVFGSDRKGLEIIREQEKAKIQKQLDLELRLAIADGEGTSRLAALVDRGADIEGGGLSRPTPLAEAALSDRPDDVAWLIDQGVNVNFQCKAKGLTALMHGAGFSSANVTHLLLDEGAEPHLQSWEGETAVTRVMTNYVVYPSIERSDLQVLLRKMLKRAKLTDLTPVWECVCQFNNGPSISQKKRDVFDSLRFCGPTLQAKLTDYRQGADALGIFLASHSPADISQLVTAYVFSSQETLNKVGSILYPSTENKRLT